ncbi:hypothetical protein DY000_02004704 [Brassica cretica]|uniref:DUF4005 domain-containing protein n=1 Tax=Brassica cretica TaxID=69181 RepID=A0ABQ7CK08_BRACR|nr:hypothetical protein DY000_02004704 [Brassica cretica]
MDPNQTRSDNIEKISLDLSRSGKSTSSGGAVRTAMSQSIFSRRQVDSSNDKRLNTLRQATYKSDVARPKGIKQEGETNFPRTRNRQARYAPRQLP